MKRHSKVSLKLLPLVLLASTCSLLSASSIPAGSIVFTNQALPLTGSASINRFNTSLGTLTGIEFVVTSASMAGTVTDQYLGSKSQPPQNHVQVTMGGDVYILDPADITNVLSDTSLSATIVGQTILNDGTINTFSGLSTTGNSSDIIDTTSDFTPFEGTGTLNLSYSVTAGTAFANSSGHPLILDNPSNAGVTGTASASLQVFYQFNDAITSPEPASLAFVGGGLLLASYFARRLRKKS